MTFDRNLLPDPTSYFEAQGLKLTGPRSAAWKTTECRFHIGSDSMRVNVQTGGYCCMNCGAKGGDVLSYEMQATGADFVGACKALGAWVDDGKPHAPQKPAPLSHAEKCRRSREKSRALDDDRGIAAQLARL